MVHEMNQAEKASVLFKDWQETMIWSCLQGVMGKVYADSREQPMTAMAVLGDFYFFAGKPDKEFVLYSSGRCEFVILVPQNKEWEKLIEKCCGENARKVVRYAIRKEPNVFDQERLAKVVNGLPKEYALQMIDEQWFWRCKEMEWCRDWVAQYEDYTMYRKWGLGVAAVKEGEVVSGASSYSSYRGGIEVQIDTREDYRRRGLACACGAKLILECLGRGWYPSWDAQNLASAVLAEKLGYHREREYVAFEVRYNH